MKKESTTT